MPFYRFDVEVFASTYAVVEADDEEQARELVEAAEPGLCYQCNKDLEINGVGDISMNSIEEIDEEEYEELRERLY